MCVDLWPAVCGTTPVLFGSQVVEHIVVNIFPLYVYTYRSPVQLLSFVGYLGLSTVHFSNQLFKCNVMSTGIL